MKKPTLSVIVPTLNEEKFVGRLLASLAAQTYRQFEVIVVDGGSSDATQAVVLSFQKRVPNLRFLKAKRSSISVQLNAGAKVARANWLVFMDADSIALSALLAEVATYISSHTDKLINTWCLPDGTGWWEPWMARLANVVGELTRLFRRQAAVENLTIVEKKVFDAVGGYDETITWGVDYEFSERLADCGVRIAFLRKCLYRQSFRRMRQEGALPTLWLYTKSGIRAIFTRKTYTAVPGYIQGGTRYQ